MGIQRLDHPRPVKYRLNTILTNGSHMRGWINTIRGDNQRRRFREEGLLALENSDDQGNYELTGEKGVITNLDYYSTGYSKVRLTFEEFVKMGRPLEIERRRISVYTPIKRNS